MAARKSGNGSPRNDSEVLKAILDQMIQMNARVEQTNARLEQTNERLDELNAKVEVGFETLNDGQRETNARLDLMNVQLGSLTRLTQRHESRLSTLEHPRKRS